MAGTENERRSTGIPELDELVEGGVPKSSTLLVTGPPGVGKSTLLREFVLQGLRNDEPCIFLCTNFTPVELEVRFLKQDKNFKKLSDKLVIIDLCSWKTKKKTKTKYAVDSLSKLNEVLELFTQAANELKFSVTGGRVVVDSLSDFLFHVTPRDLTLFFERLSVQVRELDSACLVVLEGGLHDSRDSLTFEYLSDGTINLFKDKDEKKLVVLRMANTEHSIAPRTVEIREGKFTLAEVQIPKAEREIEEKLRQVKYEYMKRKIDDTTYHSLMADYTKQLVDLRAQRKMAEERHG